MEQLELFVNGRDNHNNAEIINVRMEQMSIDDMVSELCRRIEDINGENKKIQVLNHIRQRLHSVSPLKHHPVDCVTWQPSKDVEANEYNPNSIPPPELELLHKSISEDGYTMPIVTFNSSDGIKIVDGFHRRLMEQIHSDIQESTKGYIPVTFIRNTQEGLSDRMASTIRHNRARGVHNIELMSKIVAELVEMGKGDAWICKHIGMSADELLRLKQITGLASLFNNKDFSQAWEAETVNDIDFNLIEGKAEDED